MEKCMTGFGFFCMINEHNFLKTENEEVKNMMMAGSLKATALKPATASDGVHGIIWCNFPVKVNLVSSFKFQRQNVCPVIWWKTKGKLFSLLLGAA